MPGTSARRFFSTAPWAAVFLGFGSPTMFRLVLTMKRAVRRKTSPKTRRAASSPIPWVMGLVKKTADRGPQDLGRGHQRENPLSLSSVEQIAGNVPEVYEQNGVQQSHEADTGSDKRW